MRLGAWLYNAFFVVALPILLVAWAQGSATLVTLPPAPTSYGPLLAIPGALLLLWSIAIFMSVTGLAPSNATPPSQRVTSGPYAVFSDPIYVGAALVAFGAAAWLASASGFWTVAPALAIAAAALVFGHEALQRPPLQDERKRSLMSLPEGAHAPPSLRQRVGAALQIAAWFVVLELISVASWRAAGEQWVVAIAVATPFLPWQESAWTLRRALIGFSVAILLALTVFVGSAPLIDGSATASHLVAAAATGALAGARAFSAGASLRLVHVAMLTIAASSIVAIGTPTQAGATLLTACAAAIALPAHQFALRLAEAIANSWSAIRIGPVRIINYAAYAFAAAAFGGMIFLSVVGANATPAGLLITAFVVVSAGLWGQLVEFSGRLARPFGYYGALMGAFIGVAAASMALDISPWLLGAGLALAAPVVQAIGRLRCLVQGCCHGGRVNEHARGIIYRRQQSRVLRIANLGFVPVHPTPLYSIYGNALLLLVLWRLSAAGAMQTQIIAAYLFLSGAFRFVEEAYRGEPQTPKWNRLKLYQWLAIAQGLAGVVIGLVPSEPMPNLAPSISYALVAVMMGLIAGAAMGADFPGSRRRFSQLTPTDL